MKSYFLMTQDHQVPYKSLWFGRRSCTRVQLLGLLKDITRNPNVFNQNDVLVFLGREPEYGGV
jgi:hypothetical protein